MAARESEIFGIDRRKALRSVVVGLVLVAAVVAGIGLPRRRDPRLRGVHRGVP